MTDDELNQIIIDELFIFTKWLSRQFKSINPNDIDFIIEAYLNGNNYGG